MTSSTKRIIRKEAKLRLWTRCLAVAKNKSEKKDTYDADVLYWMVRGRAVSDYSKSSQKKEQFQKWCNFFKADPGDRDLLPEEGRLRILKKIESPNCGKGILLGIWLDPALVQGMGKPGGWEKTSELEVERLAGLACSKKSKPERQAATELIPALLQQAPEQIDTPSLQQVSEETEPQPLQEAPEKAIVQPPPEVPEKKDPALPPHERRAKKAPPKPAITDVPTQVEEETPPIPAKKPNCEQVDFQVFCLLCGASDRTKKLSEALLRQVFEDQVLMQEVAQDFLDFPDYVRLLAKALGADDQAAQDFIDIVNPDAPKMIAENDQEKIKNLCELYHEKFGYRGGDPNIYMLSRAIVFRYQAIYSRATPRSSAPRSISAMRRAIGDLYAVATR